MSVEPCGDGEAGGRAVSQKGVSECVRRSVNVRWTGETRAHKVFPFLWKWYRDNETWGVLAGLWGREGAHERYQSDGAGARAWVFY